MSSKYIGIKFNTKIIKDSSFYTVTDIFGFRQWRKKKYPKNSGFHNGIDLGCKIGTAIYSPYDGVVSEVFYNVYGAGNVLTITHDTGFQTKYLHLNKINVNKGNKVKSGQIICYSGNTDGNTNFSTGPHLHFEVLVDNKNVDPAPYLYGFGLKDGKNESFVKSGQNFKINDNNTNSELYKILNAIQSENAIFIVDFCKKSGGTKRDATIAIMIGLTESLLQNTNYKGLDYYGIFQKKISENWGTKENLSDLNYSCQVFFLGNGINNKGLLSYQNRNSLSLQDVCKLVQNSNVDYLQAQSKSENIVELIWTNDITSKLDENATEIQNIKEEIEIDTYNASGIWQIVKLVIDPEVKDLQINDATISFMQGSLYNFLEKICQRPFVEFWGDTYGDQYYFIVRKPPFTRESYLSLAKNDKGPRLTITDQQVISDSFRWENDEIYSWYKLEPNGNYIGGSEVIFQYLPAVYFQEYAECFGSKPLSITTNYITFIKETDEVQSKKAENDLKFIVDIHSYLPFTRKGTINMIGDRKIKKGMIIYYEPTNEYYYVDAVSNNFSANGGIIERTTTLSVSRGMIKDYCEAEIKNKFTKSYFNLINYGSEYYNELFKKNSDYPQIQKELAYFNQDKHIWKNENNANDNYKWIDETDNIYINEGNIFYSGNLSNIQELKITKQIAQFNFDSCINAAKIIKKYSNLSFEIIGNTDSFDTVIYNNDLGLKRANNVKSLIIQQYKLLFNSDTKEMEILSNRLITKTNSELNAIDSNYSPIGRLRNRRVDWKILDSNLSNDKNTKDDIQNISWSVNKEVFMFFIRRNQFLTNLFE